LYVICVNEQEASLEAEISNSSNDDEVNNKYLKSARGENNEHHNYNIELHSIEMSVFPFHIEK